MKPTVLALTFFAVSTAMANSFDRFVGEYWVFGRPTANQWGRFPPCTKMSNLARIAVRAEADPQDSQTHEILFSFPDGGYWRFSIRNFELVYPGGEWGTVARTTGTSTSARNEFVRWGPSDEGILEKEGTNLNMSWDGTQYVLTLLEYRSEQGRSLGSCSYEVRMGKLKQGRVTRSFSDFGTPRIQNGTTD